MNFIVRWISNYSISGNKKFESYEEAKRFKQEIHESAFTLGLSIPLIHITIEVED